jgi:protease PrsW
MDRDPGRGAVRNRGARRGRLRLTGSVLGFYLLVAALHALWDAAQGVAVWLTLLLTGTQVHWQLLRLGQVPAVTQTQVHLFTVLNWGLLILDAFLGLLVLRGRWRKATTPDRREPTAPDRPGSLAAVAPVSALEKQQ